MRISLYRVSAEARACTQCTLELPQAPRPVFRVGRSARLMIVGQAPGRRVHESGIPWNDPSGEVLRAWLGMDRDSFYDTSRIAIVPAGLCYPGTVNGADLPPRPQCAPRWQPRFRAALPGIQLTLLVGSYAQAYYLGKKRKATLGKVPTLVLDDGMALYDSRVIVEFLDNVSPISRLIPEDKRHRVAVRRWEALADGVLDAGLLVRYESLRDRHERSQAWTDKQL